MCVCVGVGLPITLSPSFRECVCAREDSYREEDRWVKADWDKGLCSHECHTNKAQSDIEVQPLRWAMKGGKEEWEKER